MKYTIIIGPLETSEDALELMRDITSEAHVEAEEAGITDEALAILSWHDLDSLLDRPDLASLISVRKEDS